jgi:hypothetical protein
MGLVDEILKHLVEEAASISQAPLAFIACLLVAAAIIWIVLNWRYAAVAAHKNERIAKVTPDQHPLKRQRGLGLPPTGARRMSAPHRYGVGGGRVIGWSTDGRAFGSTEIADGPAQRAQMITTTAADAATAVQNADAVSSLERQRGAYASSCGSWR